MCAGNVAQRACRAPGCPPNHCSMRPRYCATSASRESSRLPWHAPQGDLPATSTPHSNTACKRPICSTPAAATSRITPGRISPQAWPSQRAQGPCSVQCSHSGRLPQIPGTYSLGHQCACMSAFGTLYENCDRHLGEQCPMQQATIFLMREHASQKHAIVEVAGRSTNFSTTYRVWACQNQGRGSCKYCCMCNLRCVCWQCTV